jgi:hypothetical protein
VTRARDRARPDEEILGEALSVCCALSPENLSCDGELPRGAVRAKFRLLTARLEALGREYGKPLTEDAVLAWRLHGVRP